MSPLPFLASDYLEADYAAAAVRREHQAFYSRTLRYRFLIAPRPYPTLIKSLGLMLVDCQTEKSAVLSRHPFLAARPGDAEKCSGTLKNWLQKGNDDELPFCLVKPPMEPVSG